MVVRPQRSLDQDVRLLAWHLIPADRARKDLWERVAQERPEPSCVVCEADGYVGARCERSSSGRASLGCDFGRSPVHRASLQLELCAAVAADQN